MADTNQDQEKETVLTPEQIAEKRANIIKYYTEQIEVVKLQAEYERLKAQISIDQFAAFEAKVKLAHLKQGPPEKATKQTDKK